MARRRRAVKRSVPLDVRYQSPLIGRFVSHMMSKGKKSTAQKIIYTALDQIHEETKEDPVQFVERALDNVRPRLEVKSRRVGGATYQVPIEVSDDRQVSLALRWIIQFSRTRKGVPMARALAMELMDAHKNQGSAVKKREDTFKMAQANRAFAHYRW
jgi:small subunit ribosomal protein S7